MISVVMPAYNIGGDRMYENLRETASVLNGMEYEIIIVDDGSKDSTKEGALSASKENGNIKVVSYPKNKGKGYALMRGFENSKGELVFFLDGDLDIGPQHIPRFLEIMEREDVGVVVGSRLHDDSNTSKFPLHRRFLSVVYHLFVKWFLVPVKHQAGIKLYKREVLEDIRHKVSANRYSGEIEQLALPHRMGYNILEAPIDFKVCDGGGRGMNLWNYFHTGIETLGLWIKLHTGYYDRAKK